MSTTTPETPLADEHAQESGSHERHLAAGSIAQQMALIMGTLTMLLTFTVLGRTLTLSEFGLYGLLISIPTYLVFAQGSVEVVAVRSIAQADAQFDRDRAFTTALGAYAAFGLLAALLIVFGGTALLGVFDVARALHGQAQQGLLALGLVNLLGWPAKAAQDALRGSSRFVISAATEALGYMTCGGLMLLALALSAPLWLIVGLGGAISLMVGLWATAALLFVQQAVRPRPSTLSLTYMRSFLSASLYLLASGIIDLPVYSLDRTILGAYRPVSSVGLYEGAVRAHNLVRQLQGALTLTVVPTAAAYAATGDRQRLRELLLRGTRYVSVTMMPLTVTAMALAGPILTVWLGPRFTPAAGAMTILVSYWLVMGGSSVGLSMIVAAGRLRLVLAYGVAVALLNLTISLLLTPSLGIDGVVIGTSLPYVVMAPLFMRVVCRTFAVPLSLYLRESFALSFGAGALLAGGELLARIVLPVDRATVLLAVIVIGLVGYAVGVYNLGLRPRERLLVRTTLAGIRTRTLSMYAQLAAFRSARAL